MSRKPRGVIQLILTNFFNSIRPNFTRRKFMGEDYMGTKYYEVPIHGKSSKKRPERYFEPVEKENHEQDIPAEWESWLRYRRTEPPTTEEVMANYRLIQLKRKNAAELEISYSVTAKESRALEATPNIPKETRGATSFPVYEEYKMFGQNYKLKWKNSK